MSGQHERPNVSLLEEKPLQERLFATVRIQFVLRTGWPSPWREAILDCVHQQAVIGTPIAEYLPEWLANGRLAIVGDGAHVPTPMTGKGFAALLHK